LFVDVQLEEVDVNVHPAKTEVRFRRAAAVADAVREAVRAALASAGYVPAVETRVSGGYRPDDVRPDRGDDQITPADVAEIETVAHARSAAPPFNLSPAPQQERISFGSVTPVEKVSEPGAVATGSSDSLRIANSERENLTNDARQTIPITNQQPLDPVATVRGTDTLPPLDSAIKFVREVAVESLSSNIRPLGQLEESFIIATDEEGLLLIDQHVAHERVLFDKYRAFESARRPESQQMLIPETFDLTPAQAAAFDHVAEELESYGFELMRLSGRTV